MSAGDYDSKILKDLNVWVLGNLGPASVRAMEEAGVAEIAELQKRFSKASDVALGFAWERSCDSAEIRNEFFEYFYEKGVFDGMVARNAGLRSLAETGDIACSIFGDMLKIGSSFKFHGERAYERGLRQRAFWKINALTKKARKTLEHEVLLGRGEDLQRCDSNRGELMRAIACLSTADQDLLERYYFAHQPIAEIALERDLSEDAARKRIQRLRSRLRELLDA